jgi:alkanesulfonate monooxygenase SsuD/methylene tetrahydromethanopterin reductase-like flavin-dependent oxidoreductase (luciferase family)
MIYDHVSVNYNFPPVLSFPKPAQQPHPPILLGGTARNVFQRVVEWGDGWMPNRVSADDIRRGRNTLTELAEQVGRDPQSIEILAFGFSGQFRSRVAIQELEEAGANRITIWLDQTAGEAALTEMDQIARQVFG